jgi:hypothetical protein
VAKYPEIRVSIDVSEKHIASIFDPEDEDDMFL